MQLRRTPRSRIALAAAALALAAPVLTSCGFEYATDRVYTPGVGANERADSVDVLAGVIVSTEPGSGTFIASLSNNSTTEAATLTELGNTSGQLSFGDFEPIEVPPGGLVNLAEPPAELEVTGDFAAGDFVELALVFDTGERTVIEVPVVPNAEDYAGLDGPAPAPEETPTETETEAH